MKTVRTRFAPSPTGFMHIGSVRTALFAYLIAKQNNGSFILRIEDTDQKRYVEGALDVIYDTLKALELNWDEGPDVGGDFGPYVQSERNDSYMPYAERLIEEGKAYYCFCDENRLEALKEKAEHDKVAYKYDGHCRNLSVEEAKKRISNGEKYVVRFKMPKEGKTIFNDLVYDEIEVDNSELEDLILMKSDGYPTYNFANIIDDTLMGITHIIRGNEYISSTPKYVLIYQAFGFDVPEFIHLPIIKKEANSDKKLSKRDGDATVDNLNDNGYLNKAIINMCALTGWSPSTNKELFTLKELVQEFDVSRITKVNAIFDIEKLKWMNHHYVQELNDKELYDFFARFIKDAYGVEDSDWLKELIVLYQDEIYNAETLVDHTSLFFKKELELDDECREFMSQEGVDKTISVFKGCISSINEWNRENINNAIIETKEKAEVKGKMLYMPIRIAVSGQMHGPELVDTIYLLGKEVVLSRLGD